MKMKPGLVKCYITDKLQQISDHVDMSYEFVSCRITVIRIITWPKAFC